MVDVIGFNDKTWLAGTGTFHTDALHITERYTRVDKDQINYEVTMEDPNVLTKPWTLRSTIMLREGTRLQEYLCAENNLDPGPLRTAPEGRRQLHADSNARTPGSQTSDFRLQELTTLVCWLSELIVSAGANQRIRRVHQCAKARTHGPRSRASARQVPPHGRAAAINPDAAASPAAWTNQRLFVFSAMIAAV